MQKGERKMFKRILSLALITITATTLFVGCGKQEDTPIIIDELPDVVATMDYKVENLPATDDENVKIENLPATEEDETETTPIEYTMEELRQMRIQRMNSHIPPIRTGYIGCGKFRIPTRPIVPVPIVQPNQDLVDKIVEFLKQNLIKPQPIGPIMPIYPRLGNNIFA